MTDNEIIKALECLASGCFDCNDGCKESKECPVEIIRETIDLINRQKAEIERLSQPVLLIENNQPSEKELLGALKTGSVGVIPVSNVSVRRLDEKGIKSEAIKEFAERLTDKICENVNKSLDNPKGYDYYPIDVYADIDNLLKEMVGDAE